MHKPFTETFACGQEAVIENLDGTTTVIKVVSIRRGQVRFSVDAPHGSKVTPRRKTKLDLNAVLPKR